MAKHGGKIVIGEKEVLSFLGYPDGKLHFFGRSEDYNATVAVIEHPNLPKVKEGEMIPIVNPTGIYWNLKDHYTLRITRTSLWGRILTCTNAFVYCWKLYGIWKTQIK